MRTPGITPDEQAKILNGLVMTEQLKQALKYVNYGLAGGAVAGGGAALLQRLGRRVIPPSSTFTAPVRGPVYVPNNAKAKLQAGELEEESKVAQLGAPAQAIDPSNAAAITQMANDRAMTPAMKLLGAALGVPAGWYLSRKLVGKGDEVRRSQELEEMQRQYEQELQLYAATKVKPQVRGVRKIASTPNEQLMERLAANTVEIAKHAAIGTNLKQMLAAYFTLVPLTFGAAGFADQWQNGKNRELASAEKRLQMLREKKNPTAANMSLNYIPEVNAAGARLEKRESVKKRLVDNAVDGSEMSYVL